MDQPLADPVEDAAAWGRLQHRLDLERKERYLTVLKLSFFALPAAILVFYARWALFQGGLDSGLPFLGVTEVCGLVVGLLLLIGWSLFIQPRAPFRIRFGADRG